jgi:hypothetical protein
MGEVVAYRFFTEHIRNKTKPAYTIKLSDLKLTIAKQLHVPKVHACEVIRELIKFGIIKPNSPQVWKTFHIVH